MALPVVRGTFRAPVSESGGKPPNENRKHHEAALKKYQVVFVREPASLHELLNRVKTFEEAARHDEKEGRERQAHLESF